MIENFKLNFFYIRKAFFVYQRGFQYLYYRYIIAPRILKIKTALERPVNNQDLSIHVLSCHRDVIMLAWSLASFYSVASIVGQLYIHNDGSLTLSDKKIIKILFPSAIVIDPDSLESNLNNKLSDFPIIKQIRFDHQDLVLLKKIIDPYFVSDKKVHLIIDSDLLWFNNPQEINNEILAQIPKSLMIDGVGIPCPVYFNDDTKIEKRLAIINSGIVLYHKDNFNLAKLSEYFKKID